MSKISDRELLELENDDLKIPIQKFKKKNKINKKEKYPDHKRVRRKQEIWDYELDSESDF